MDRPRDDEYGPHFRGYVSQVPEHDVLSVLETQTALMQRLKTLVAPEKEVFAYGPGKWTTREVIGHINDVERVFGFRIFCFSRSDANPLPGFDENDYVSKGAFNATPLAEHVDDFAALRLAHLRLLRRLSDPQFDCSGTANGRTITVRALAFVMAGHVRHHLRLLGERYGIPAIV